MKYKFFCFFFLLTLFFQGLFADNFTYKTIEDRSGLSILNPTLQERKTLKIRLENGLSAYLISDPGTHQSGAALAVGVGSWDDPVGRPGMAHFVEHLLFLGTEKYPDEESYQRYIDEYGGDRNAYTMADRTVYMFTVDNNGFLGAIDRFAQFFIAPLFNPSGVDRESKAIDQEFCKNVPLDAWRVMHVRKELANPNHPFHTFSIGNKLTLANISQDELKQWYNEKYSAHQMHLVVYSDLPLEELQEQVIEHFSAIKNKNYPSHSIETTMFLPEAMGKMVVVNPVQHLQTLELSWELPKLTQDEKEICSADLLSYVLGHEGEGSLLQHLKEEGLAEALRAGSQKAGKDQCLFFLSIQLTSRGLQHYEQVIEKCFSAIAHLRQKGIPKYIFDEIIQMKTLAYAFQERIRVFDFISDLASEMVDEDLETFPRKTLMPTRYSEEKTKELIQCLNPKKCLYALIAPPQLLHTKLSRKEKWMGVQYTILPIAEKKLNKWGQLSVCSALSLPNPNRFVPKTLEIVKEVALHAKGIIHPHLIYDNDNGKIYHAKDTRFGLPQVSWNFIFKTPLIKDDDTKSQIFADLYCHALQERLAQISYEAYLGGLSFNIERTHNGLQMKVHGFSEKACELLDIILISMKTLKITPAQFTQYVDLGGRDYANSASKTPVNQGLEVLWSVLYKDYTAVSTKAEKISQVNYDQFIDFCASLWNSCYVEAILYDNMKDNDAYLMTKRIHEVLNAEPYYRHLHPQIELASLPSQQSPSYVIKNSTLPGNALIFTADCGEFSFKRRAAQEILTKGLEEPFFSELRTKQQTGYIITNWSQEIERHLYCFFLVQSSSHDTRDLLSRFELFFESTLQNLSSSVIPESRFESIKASLITAIENPADHMNKMSETLKVLAFDYDEDFFWLEKRIEGLKELTYQEFKNYAQEFLGKENKKRLAVCVNGSMKKDEILRYRKISNMQKLRNEISYSGRKKTELNLTSK